MSIINSYDEILFIGSYAKGTYLSSLFEKKAYVQMAANTVEGYYIREIIKQVNVPFHVFSALVTVPYPKCEVFNITSNYTIDGNVPIHNVGFNNCRFIVRIAQKLALTRYINHWIKEKKNKSFLVIVYSLKVAYLDAAKRIVLKNPNSKVLCIVPDLPKYMHGKEGPIRKILTNLNSLLINSKKKIIDGYVLYAKKMADSLNISKPWIVIEGLYNEEKTQIVKKNDNDYNKKFIVMYAGGLSRLYGIDRLVEGFILAKMQDAELHLYGKGIYSDNIIEYTKKFKQIKYFGMCSHEYVKTKMANADLLVNPRPPNSEYTRYSCPSKIIEYLSSGTPTLLTRLEGIPDEYYLHAYELNDDSVEGIAKMLRTIKDIPLSERVSLGDKARSFVLNEKSSQKQVNKLLTLAASLKK